MTRRREESTKDRDLTERERRVLIEYVIGEDDVVGNATKAYQRVYPNANANTASVAGSELLKLPKAQEFLEQLHCQVAEVVPVRVRPWMELVPESQAIILATARGRLRNRLAFEASVYIVNRALGSPVSSHDVHVTDDARILKAIAAFTRRVATQTGSGDADSTPE